MMRRLRSNTFAGQLWREEHGFVQVASHLILVGMIAIGGIIGLSTFRIVIVQQFGDIAQALYSINQSYSISVGTMTSTYTDTLATSIPAQTPGNEPYGIDVHSVPATTEN
jgi:hypothetical protein